MNRANRWNCIFILIAFLEMPTIVFAQELPTSDTANRTISIPTELKAPLPFSFERFPVLKKPRIGLVLSGGGARGLAQIGVLRALEEAGIEPDLVVGTSIGAIIGGLYSSGYTVDQLERTVKRIDWDDLLRLSNQTGRQDLLVDQKPIVDRALLTLRFDGLRMVLPEAVSNGQRLTNLLNELVLEGIYHTTSFDNLEIPFRAVTTDLYTGNRVILGSGNLAEAMRASSTVPVLYSAVPMDSMALVDGGLKSNIPVDVARSMNCDIVIAVNTTSPPRPKELISNPLETLDQVFNLLMEQSNVEQLRDADVVITPEISEYLSTDFSEPDSLIALGYKSAFEHLPSIQRSIEEIQKNSIMRTMGTHDGLFVIDSFASSRIAEMPHSMSPLAAYLHALDLMESDLYEYVTLHISENPSRIRVTGTPRPLVRSVFLHGTDKISEAIADSVSHFLVGRPYSYSTLRSACESILTAMRRNSYALAHIDTVIYDAQSGSVIISVDEGRVGSILIEGNTRTNSVVVLREFPIQPGDVFRLDNLKLGMNSLAATNLFHQVRVDIEHEYPNPIMVIRVEERPSQLLQLGILINDENNAQAAIELKDANIFGTGSEVGVQFFGGFENRRYSLLYRTNRIFYTNLSFQANLYYDLEDFNQYNEKIGLPIHEFDRTISQSYRSIKYGGVGTAGFYVQKFGHVTGHLRVEEQQLRTIQSQQELSIPIAENHRIVSIGFGTLLDTQDRFPFPRTGQYLHAMYTSAQSAFGSEVAFTKVTARYELYISDHSKLFTMHPRVLFGYGDRTMPRTEEFRIGGMDSFFGMRKNEFNGRQLFTGSVEIRYQLPVSILFDTYAAFRYDIGRTWEIPEQIKFSRLRHGIGCTISIDTPIGPASFAVGKSFYFVQSSSSEYIKWGPLTLYFSIGAPI